MFSFNQSRYGLRQLLEFIEQSSALLYVKRNVGLMCDDKLCATSHLKFKFQEILLPLGLTHHQLTKPHGTPPN